MNEKLFFKHDLYALEDRPLRKIIIKHGATGYAVFFVALEFFYKENGVAISIEDMTFDVSEKLHLDEKQTTDILLTCVENQLFEQDKNGLIFSKRVQEACHEMESFYERQRTNGAKGGAPKNNKNAQKQPKNNPVVDFETTQKQPLIKIRIREEEDKDKNNKKKNIQEEEKQPCDIHTLISELKDFWNERCVLCPPVLKVTCIDEMNLSYIMEDPQITPEVIKDQMIRIQNSDFATGKSEKGWKMTFNKFIQDFTGVLNGKYDGNRDSVKASGFKPKDLSAIHRDAQVQEVDCF